jgi:hypothetical protein
MNAQILVEVPTGQQRSIFGEKAGLGWLTGRPMEYENASFQVGGAGHDWRIQQ